MADEKKVCPYTINIDNKINNELPPPYGLSGPSSNPSSGPDQQQDQKSVPAAPQSSAPNETSTFISLPEIIENHETKVLITDMDFTEKTIRHGFIKKVFGIVLLQLLITALVVFGLLQSYQYIIFAADNVAIVFGISAGVYFVTFLAMICFVDARRKVPYNYIFLMLFTLSVSVMVSMALTRFNFEQIMFAVGSTFAIVLTLTMFAFQTKIDFTILSGTCLCLLLPLTLLGVGALTMSCDTMYLVCTTVGVIVISIYIVWDIQLIVGGDHRYGFCPEDYVFAALVLYVDIMYLFLKLLRYIR